MKNNLKNKQGFTLVELMVSVAIFALMTSFLLAKYGKFNQSVLLTNLAYDVALTIRNAQSYGLNVRSVSAPGVAENFDTAYGVNFDMSRSTSFVFFSDNSKNGTYLDPSSQNISEYTIKRGSVISDICIYENGDVCTSNPNVNISFIRPNPDAIIKKTNGGGPYSSAQITLTATDGSVKKIRVRSTGQIAITN